MKLYDHKTLGGILLVAGTSIGAGMLALPITTGAAGFLPATFLFLLCYLYMMLALFLLLEANLYEPSIEANIISMTKKHLGAPGQLACWLAFLMLLYSVAAAYISAGGSLVAKLMYQGEVNHQNSLIGTYLFAGTFSLIVYFGAWLVDYINRFLMIGLLVAYIALVVFVAPHVQLVNLTVMQPNYLWAAVPVVVLSFTSHLIVPTLRMYFNNSVPKLKQVLFIGHTLPLVFYLIWEFNILGVIPIHGQGGLQAIADGPHPLAGLTHALHHYLGLKWVAAAFGFFSFFALVTSFQAVMLSLMDFLSDGLQIAKTRWGSLRLLMMTIIPPLLFAVYYPDGFVLALSYAGVFVAILYGILSPLMVWKARYRDKVQGNFKVLGGKPLLVVVLLLAVVIIFLQIAATLHWLPA